MHVGHILEVPQLSIDLKIQITAVFPIVQGQVTDWLIKMELQVDVVQIDVLALVSGHAATVNSGKSFVGPNPVVPLKALYAHGNSGIDKAVAHVVFAVHRRFFEVDAVHWWPILQHMIDRVEVNRLALRREVPLTPIGNTLNLLRAGREEHPRTTGYLTGARIELHSGFPFDNKGHINVCHFGQQCTVASAHPGDIRVGGCTLKSIANPDRGFHAGKYRMVGRQNVHHGIREIRKSSGIQPPPTAAPGQMGRAIEHWCRNCVPLGHLIAIIVITAVAAAAYDHQVGSIQRSDLVIIQLCPVTRLIIDRVAFSLEYIHQHEIVHYTVHVEIVVPGDQDDIGAGWLDYTHVVERVCPHLAGCV